MTSKLGAVTPSPPTPPDGWHSSPVFQRIPQALGSHPFSCRFRNFSQISGTTGGNFCSVTAKTVFCRRTRARLASRQPVLTLPRALVDSQLWHWRPFQDSRRGGRRPNVHPCSVLATTRLDRSARTNRMSNRFLPACNFGIRFGSSAMPRVRPAGPVKRVRETARTRRNSRPLPSPEELMNPGHGSLHLPCTCRGLVRRCILPRCVLDIVPMAG